MTNVEHLIENAIHSVKEHESFETFKNRKCNDLMFLNVSVKPEEIWLIAQHILFTYKPSIEEQMIERYGYDPPEV